VATTLLAVHPSAAPSPREIPLCVDLDGTLIRTDLLFESLLAAVRRRWWIIFLAPFWLLRGRPFLKQRLADAADFDPALLPYRHELLAWLREEKSRGRRLILATGSHHKLASAVARHLGIFDEVMATDAVTNLTSHSKAKRLIHEFGPGGFDYVGDSSADVAVWKHARRRIAAGAAARRPQGFDAAFGEHKSKLRILTKQLRVKHWVKNILVFLPLAAGHRILEPLMVLRALLDFTGRNTLQIKNRVEWFLPVNGLIGRAGLDPAGLGGLIESLRKSDDPVIALFANLEAVAPRTPDRVLPLL